MSDTPALEPFKDALARQEIHLTRSRLTTLQINTGLLCNQACAHCHLDAGPHRREVMTEETMTAVINLAERHAFETIDITGGAPELTPCLTELINGLAPQTNRLMIRSNLTAINTEKHADLLDLYQKHRVILMASFPSLNEAQAEAQRGLGVFAASLATLKKLNDRGYGQPGSDLELNLVSNPSGAFLPPDQADTERHFRTLLQERWGLLFNNLYTFANMPMGRFRTWLEKTGNLEGYQLKLAASFNPCAVQGLMCRSLLSVSWDGYLFDCDFNQAIQLGLAGRRIHLTELAELPGPGDAIGVEDHCYTCTAGAGFT